MAVSIKSWIRLEINQRDIPSMVASNCLR
jgi:hypothetical protein